MQPIYVIAECAQGYASRSVDESIFLALLLTRCAKSAGADAVKFQLVIASELSTTDYKYYDLFKSLELGYGGWRQVADLSNELNIDLIFDIFGSDSLRMAEDLGSSAVKIHPTDFSNRRLINEVARSTINNVIAGCGGATCSEIHLTVDELQSSKSLTLLHGFQGYPTSRVDNCLSRLQFLRSFIDKTAGSLTLGFADHADPLSPDSTHLAVASLGYGVSVIEKHLTLAKCLQLEDYESAMAPDEFRDFVLILRSCQEAHAPDLVDLNTFDLPESEKNYRRAVERHVVSKYDLEAGHTITSDDLCLKRTAAAHPITNPLSVIGKTTNRSLKVDTPFTHEILQ